MSEEINENNKENENKENIEELPDIVLPEEKDIIVDESGINKDSEMVLKIINKG